jgi:hypothetical protein
MVFDSIINYLITAERLLLAYSVEKLEKMESCFSAENKSILNFS